MSDDLDDADKAALRGIAARREGTQVCFYEPAKAISAEVLRAIESTLRGGQVTKETYYTLLIADMLPPDVHRALYIDGDIICTGSFDALFETDLKGCPVAMCLDLPQLHIWTYNRLDYPAEEGYYNLGVMLVDLDLWRKENLTKPMFDYLAVNAKKLTILSQDLINAVLHGRIFTLDISYNILIGYYYVYYWQEEEKNGYLACRHQSIPKDKWPALLAAAENPRLVHITSKPWFKDCNIPFAPVWRYFYAQSPWAKEPLKRYKPKLPANATAKAKIKRLGRRALERLNLIAPTTIPYPEEAYKVAQRVLDSVTQ